MSDVIRTIRGKYPSLTKKQKDIAGYMLEHPDDMCFITLKQLSADNQVSEMTVLNLCSALGYTNFNHLKSEFRKYSAQRRMDMENPAGYEGGEGGEGIVSMFTQLCRQQAGVICDYCRMLRAEDYRKAAIMVCKAEKVIVCGRGVGYMLAEYISTRLSMCGMASMSVNTELGERVGSALNFVGGGCLVIPVSFPDYYSVTVKMAQCARNKGAALLGITDSTRAEISCICDMCLYCPTENRFFPNSLSVPVLAVDFLMTAVSLEKSRGDGTGASEKPDFLKISDGGF